MELKKRFSEKEIENTKKIEIQDERKEIWSWESGLICERKKKKRIRNKKKQTEK